MSFLTGTSCELIYASIAAGTAKNTFTSEAQINDTTGMGVQAVLPPRFFPPSPAQAGRGVKIVASGILSSTGTPTFTWSVRLGAAGNTTTAQVGATAALTTVSSAASQIWRMELDLVSQSPGADGANTTIRGTGLLWSPGLATTVNAVFGGAASPGTASIDTSISNFINFNAACGTSSASNSIQLLELLVFGLN